MRYADKQLQNTEQSLSTLETTKEIAPAEEDTSNVTIKGIRQDTPGAPNSILTDIPGHSIPTDVPGHNNLRYQKD